MPRYAIVTDSPVGADLLALLEQPTETPLAGLTRRATFFLGELLAAGAEGITTIDYPGVRVGDAIYKLRCAGVKIETRHEAHGGEFSGHHGRYVLKSRIVRLDVGDVHGQRLEPAQHSSGAGIPTPTQATP